MKQTPIELGSCKALYQHLTIPHLNLFLESIIVDRRTAGDLDVEALLNLVAESDYVSPTSSFSFRHNDNEDYVYTYFNFLDLSDSVDV